MDESEIHMHPPTDTRTATENMNRRRRDSDGTNNVYERWNTLRLLPLCYQLQVAWQIRLQFSKRLASSLALKWNQPYSSTMNWLRTRITFHCSVLQFSVFVAHDPDVDMLPGPTPQWTWPCLNYTLRSSTN